MLYPDWMLMYLINRRKVPRRVLYCAFSMDFVMYALGCLLVLLCLIFAFILLTFKRLWLTGSYGEYHRWDAKPMINTGLFPLLSFAIPVALGGILFLIRVPRMRSSLKTSLQVESFKAQ